MDQSAEQQEEIVGALSTEARDNGQHSATTPPVQKATYGLIGREENPRFFGRDNELEMMSRELLSSTNEQLRIFGLFGMPGVGKSHVALRFVYKHLKKFDGVFWVSADTPMELERDFIGMAKELRLFDDVTLAPKELVRQKVFEWLTTTTQTWLLVLDNVQDKHIIEDYWYVSKTGRIIFTSRNLSDMEYHGTQYAIIEPFDLQEGVAAFLSSLPDNVKSEHNAEKNARIISSGCGGFPYMLDRYARFLEDNHVSIDYLSRISSSIAPPRDGLSVPRGINYQHHGELLTLWWERFPRFCKPETNMLEILSWFDPDSIPVNVWLPKTYYEQSQAHHVAENECIGVFRILFSHGYVNGGTQGRGLTMHRGAQAMIIQAMTIEERERTFHLVLDLLYAAIPNRSNWEQFGKLLPHIRRFESLRHDLKIEPREESLYKLGSVYQRASLYLTQKCFLDASSLFLTNAEFMVVRTRPSERLSRAETEHLEDTIIDIISTKASMNLAQCRFSEAKDLYAQCLSRIEAKNSPSQNELCTMTNNVGDAFAKMGRYREAYAFVQKAFHMRQALLASALDPGIYKEEVADEWMTLAGCLWLEGDYSAALKYANESTKLCEEIYGKDNIAVARRYGVFGNILKSQNRLYESKQYHLKALDICRRNYSSHYTTALAYHRYGKILAEEGNTLGAIDHVRKAIEVLADNPHFTAADARSHHYLAELFHSLSNGDSIQYLEKAALLCSHHLSIPLEMARGRSMQFFDKLVSFWDW
ncbi:hypothetical protein GQX73_g6267 [Xylaria multiplex]|uniref:NB-ARC domain-containing protein n=1 Tax=Xylaria multiplex TaxID=323545 RepID=A0A7C8IQP1_9PEZI|nr:hypothetical protein GQX73_g6267 [Xylaria multiplex]